MKKIILFISVFMFFSGCAFLKGSVKPQKQSVFTIKVKIPDRGMAISVLNKQASVILGKSDLSNPVKFIYKKFSGNDVIIFKTYNSKISDPLKIESFKGGYNGIYVINHSDKELAKLKNFNLERIKAKSSSLEFAVEEGIKRALQKKVGEDKEINITGSINIVNVFSIKYASKSVTVDFLIAYDCKKGGKLGKKEKADFYAEIGLSAYYHKDKDKAYRMAGKGLDLYENCDKCNYLNGFLNLKDKNYERAIYFLEKATALNKDKLYYFQELLKAYYEIYPLINASTEQGKKYKEEIQRKAFEVDAFISRHFNPDGSVYHKKNPPVSKEMLKLNLPETNEIKLKNDLKVITYPQNVLPVFNLTVLFDFGSVNNPKGKMGMIEAVLDLLKEGADGKSSEEIALFIDKYGLSLSSYVAADYSEIECSSLSENAQKCIELVDMLIKKAEFPKEEFKKYIKKRFEYYRAKTARASYLANKLLYRLVFGKHNYGYYDATLKSLSSIKYEDIKNFYGDYFNSANAYVIVAGSFDESVVSSVKSSFSNWKKGKKIQIHKNDEVKPLKDKREFIYLIDRPSSKQAVIYYGQTIPPYSSKEIIPFYMGNLVFGGSASSRLFMRLREKEGLTYGAYSYVLPRRESGLFKAGLSVRNEVVGKALDSLLSELKKFKDSGVTESELNDQKGLETGSFAMKLEGFGYVSMIIKKKVYGLPEDYFKNYTRRISKLKVSDVNKAVKDIIVPDKGMVVIVGDASEISKQVKYPFVVFDENLKLKSK